MPIDERRRDEIEAAVAAYAAAHREEPPLPRRTAALLTVMFPSEDVCQRSLDAIAEEGRLDRKSLPRVLRRLVAAGFLSREQGQALRHIPIGCISRRPGHERRMRYDAAQTRHRGCHRGL